MKALIVAGGTGGHVYPALAVAHFFRKKQIEIVWMGNKNSLEEKIITKEEYSFISIKSKGFRGKNLLSKAHSVFLLVLSLFTSLREIRNIKPNFIFTTGGFISLAPGLACYLLSIPIFIHEQNSIPGTANKILAKISEKTFEGFVSSFKKNHDVEFVGNPIRKEILDFNFKNKSNLNQEEKLNLLILGGSQGSSQLNEIVISSLELIGNKENWRIFHQTGSETIEKVKNTYKELGFDSSVKQFIENMADAYNEADIIISRAGAMTITEIARAGRASILFPLPWSIDNHQMMNALFLKELGASEIISFLPNETASKNLAHLLMDLSSNAEKRLNMGKAAKSGFISDSTERIYKSINESLNKKI